MHDFPYNHQSEKHYAEHRGSRRFQFAALKDGSPHIVEITYGVEDGEVLANAVSVITQSVRDRYKDCMISTKYGYVEKGPGGGITADLYLATDLVSNHPDIETAIRSCVDAVIKNLEQSDAPMVLIREIAPDGEYEEDDFDISTGPVLLDSSRELPAFLEDLKAVPSLREEDLKYIEKFTKAGNPLDLDFLEKHAKVFPFVTAALLNYEYARYQSLKPERKARLLEVLIPALTANPTGFTTDVNEIWELLEKGDGSGNALMEFLILTVERWNSHEDKTVLRFIIDEAFELIDIGSTDENKLRLFLHVLSKSDFKKQLKDHELEELVRKFYPLKISIDKTVWPKYHEIFGKVTKERKKEYKKWEKSIVRKYGQGITDFEKDPIDGMSVDDRLVFFRWNHDEEQKKDEQELRRLFHSGETEDEQLDSEFNEPGFLRARMSGKTGDEVKFMITYADGTKKVAEEFESYPVIMDNGSVYFVDEKGVRRKFVDNCETEASCHLFKPDLYYTEVQTEWPPCVHKPAQLEKVDRQESKDILSQTTITGEKYKGRKLTAAKLKRAGLSPKYKIKVRNITVYFSAPFKTSRHRETRIAYIKTRQGVFCRTIYASNSHCLWRLMPSYGVGSTDGNIDHYGKGYGEHGINLPFELIKALQTNADECLELSNEDTDFFTASPAVQTKKPDKDGFINQIIMDALGGQTRAKDHKSELPEDYSLAVKPLKYKRAKTRAEINFTNIVDDFEFNSNLYGKVRAEVYLSKDGTRKYIFFRDKLNRVWSTDPEIAAEKLSSYGVPKRFEQVDELETPAFNYASRTNTPDINFGLEEPASASLNSTYVDVFPRLILRKSPIIQAYCQARGIEPYFKT